MQSWKKIITHGFCTNSVSQRFVYFYFIYIKCCNQIQTGIPRTKIIYSKSDTMFFIIFNVNLHVFKVSPLTFSNFKKDCF
ncbi:Uncharacterised protein [Leclercia adecarboxylata]|nr:Uncharacterised protein [Leclercia adecarboxylata]